jgi:acyl-CoA synthetase (AMP-forming)/AMP-acid ligase II/1-acyl-sn-glycerol-3-phosphate acyltransferase/acyl carrier protein
VGEEQLHRRILAALSDSASLTRRERWFKLSPVSDAVLERPATFVDSVRARASKHPTRPFVTFLADGDRDERTLTFGDLEARALAVAGELARRGLKPGDRVLVMLPTGLEFLETFFGIALAGMVAVPVYPPARLTRLDHYLRTLASIAETSSCRASVLDERLVPLVGKHVTFEGRSVVTDAELRAAKAPGRAFALEAASPAFLQFTSGTTSQPRGVLLRHEHVQAQLQAYNEALAVGEGEVIVSWLPLYHDLGLVGMVLAALEAGGHLVLLSPVDFLKEPMSWIRALSRHRGIHTAAPNFAFELCVRKCTPERLRAEKIDLASVENMGMGGEPVSWATVEKFRAHFAPFGFKGEALNPCYGLAENTLVATGHRRGEPLRSVTLSQSGLQTNEVREPSSDADRATLVGNGRPFPGMTVRIVGPGGEDLGERRIGEIRVASPSLAAGYFGDREATDATFVEHEGKRWLRTGDLGFVVGGDLYICGRKKDLLIVHGKNFHPQDLEQEASAVKGVRAGNAVAFSVDRGDGAGEAAVLVAEIDPRAGRSADEVRRDVIEAISGAFQLGLADVVLLPQGSIPKTSSGKLQRGLVKEAYRKGELATLHPPGRIGTSLVKLRLGWDSLKHRVLGRAADAAVADAVAAGDLDPRFGEAMRRVRPDLKLALSAGLRVDGLGLDSLERVELFLQLARLYQAKVPDHEWSSSRTAGEVQAILERYEGTGTADAGAESSLLVRELLAAAPAPRPAFVPPRGAPVAWRAFETATRVFWGLRAAGLENVAREGAFILAGNHESYLDPAWIRLVLPVAVREKLVAFQWAGAPGFTRPFLAHMDTIPIDPTGSFHRSISDGLAELRASRVVLIFPEGARTHAGQLMPFRPGVGFLSLLSGRPIVPFRVRGMFAVYPRHRALPRFLKGRGEPMEVRFGPAIVPPTLDPEKAWEQARQLVRALREAVERM